WSCAVEQRVSALVALRHVHHQTSTDLRNNLQLRVHSSRSLPPSSDATPSAQKTLVVGERLQLDWCHTPVILFEIYARVQRLPLNKYERLFSTLLPVFAQQFLPCFIACSE